MRRGRPPYQDILTPREWEVADLLTQGLTNEEIAAKLGISFGGAKYHVAEILSKLGVSSREEAVERLKEHRRPRAGLLGLLPWPFRREREASPLPLLLAGGGVAVAVVLGALLLPGVLRGDRSDLWWEFIYPDAAADFGPRDGDPAKATEASDLSSYYYEARATGRNERPLPGNSGRGPVEQSDNTIRAWYSASEGWRWDMLNTETGERLVSQMIPDGTTLWVYDGDTNTYTRSPVPEEMRGGSGPFTSSMLGRLPPGGVPASRLGVWRSVGRERILDREVEVFELRLPDNTTMLWVDTEHDFVLRHMSQGELSSYDFEVTRIEYDRPVSARDLTFTAPLSSRQVSAPPSQVSGSGSLGPIGGTHAVPPPGFMGLTYVPEGYVTNGASSRSDSSNRTTAYTVRYAGPSEAEPSLTIEQQFRAGGLPAAMKAGEVVSVGGATAYRQSSGGEERLVWASGDLIATISSSTLPLEELLRIAEGMR